MSQILTEVTSLTPELHPFIETVLEERFLLPPQDIFPEAIWPRTLGDLAVALGRPFHELRRELTDILAESIVPRFVSPPEISGDLEILDVRRLPADLQDRLSYFKERHVKVALLCRSKAEGFSAAMHLKKLGITVSCCAVDLTH
jgi:hypothetical protein